VAYWKILLLSGFVPHLKYTFARICLNKVFTVLTLPPCSCQESCKTAFNQVFYVLVGERVSESAIGKGPLGTRFQPDVFFLSPFSSPILDVADESAVTKS